MKPRYLIVIFALALILLILFFLLPKNHKQSNWRFFIKDQIGAQSVLNTGKNLTFDQKSIYFIDGKGLLHSINKQTGNINWQKKLSDHSPFEITQDEKYLYVASFNSHIYQIDKSNGFISWSFAIPNQFWPDTEVIFDLNDEYVFFADRAGILYALERNSGKLIWKKSFGSIDTTKTFIQNSIHFGFLTQEDDVLLADHFPTKKIYSINKKSGEVLSTKDSELKINLKTTEEKLLFENYLLEFEQNIIDQPKINLFDIDGVMLWSYRPENRINRKEIYQNELRLYYLNADNTILESIYIDEKDPNKEFFTKINFTFNENFTAHHPYKNSNPQVNSEEMGFNLIFNINKKIDQIKYFLKNLEKLFSFSNSYVAKQNFIEFNITHEENFYENVFNDVEIVASFKNQETKHEINVKGFYFDHNTWKVRARLAKGAWDWNIKIKTKYANKALRGSIIITENFKEPLEIIDGSFTDKSGEIFFPLGIQDVVLDKSKDGNNLNNMDYAKNAIPSNLEENYNFLNFPDYLDLYKQEAKLNIFRYGPDNWAPSIWEDLSNKKNFAMNVKGNLQGEQILEELQKRDYKIMMSIFAFYPPYTSRESISKKENREVLEKYLDYVIARYASSIDIWELTNEAAPPLVWQNFISDYIAMNDPYGHPITTNLEEPELNNSDLLSIHLYIQKPENNYHLINQLDSLLNKQDQQKAIIISEFGFQGSNYFTGSADWLRKFSWITTLKKIGLVFWNTGYGLYENPFNGNVYLGPQERKYLDILRNFMPRINLNAINKGDIKIDQGLAIYSLKNSDYELYYLLNLKDGNEVNHKLEINNQKPAKIEVIDPKTGNKLVETNLSKEESLIQLPGFVDDISIKVIY